MSLSEEKQVKHLSTCVRVGKRRQRRAPLRSRLKAKSLCYSYRELKTLSAATMG